MIKIKIKIKFGILLITWLFFVNPNIAHAKYEVVEEYQRTECLNIDIGLGQIDEERNLLFSIKNDRMCIFELNEQTGSPSLIKRFVLPSWKMAINGISQEPILKYYPKLDWIVISNSIGQIYVYKWNRVENTLNQLAGYLDIPENEYGRHDFELSPDNRYLYVGIKARILTFNVSENIGLTLKTEYTSEEINTRYRDLTWAPNSSYLTAVSAKDT